MRVPLVARREPRVYPVAAVIATTGHLEMTAARGPNALPAQSERLAQRAALALTPLRPNSPPTTSHGLPDREAMLALPATIGALALNERPDLNGAPALNVLHVPTVPTTKNVVIAAGNATRARPLQPTSTPKKWTSPHISLMTSCGYST
jgi:hypothetical protein